MKINKYEIMNRGTKEGFRKYMEANPFYFKDVFGDKTIDEAWAETRKIDLTLLKNEQEGK